MNDMGSYSYVYVVIRANVMEFGPDEVEVVTQTRREAEEYIKSKGKRPGYYDIAEVPYKHHN